MNLQDTWRNLGKAFAR